MRLAEFDRRLEAVEYPTTTAALARRFEGAVIDLQNGAEGIDALLSRIAPETFTSPEEARLSVYGALPVGAIGRRGYSDRDPPGVGEIEPVSF